MTIPVPQIVYLSTDSLAVVELESTTFGGADANELYARRGALAFSCVAVGVFTNMMIGQNLRLSEQTQIPNDWFLIRELEVEGEPRGEVLVSLTASAGQDGAKLYAPLTVAQMADSLGRERLKVLGVEGETERAALTAARAVLLGRITYAEKRTYKTTQIPETIPCIGQTVRIAQDGFTGTLISKPGLAVSQPGGPLELTLILVDLRRAL